jgi:hypothetical protein
MPTLSRFYGIAIRMYPQDKEHNPPHIHAIYGEDVGVFRIADGSLLEGSLSPRASAMVKQWIAKHKDELLDVWETNEWKPIDPLQ